MRQSQMIRLCVVLALLTAGMAACGQADPPSPSVQETLRALERERVAQDEKKRQRDASDSFSKSMEEVQALSEEATRILERKTAYLKAGLDPKPEWQTRLDEITRETERLIRESGRSVKTITDTSHEK